MCSLWPLLLGDTLLHLVVLGISEAHEVTMSNCCPAEGCESTNSWGQDFACNMGWNLWLSRWGNKVYNSSEPLLTPLSNATTLLECGLDWLCIGVSLIKWSNMGVLLSELIQAPDPLIASSTVICIEGLIQTWIFFKSVTLCSQSFNQFMCFITGCDVDDETCWKYD